MSIKLYLTIGAISGAFSYVLLYIGKSFIEDHLVLGLPLDAVAITVMQKGVVSSINAVISIIIAVFLGIVLQPALKKY